MSRIYWRIFLSFWVVILVTTAITVGLGALVLQQDLDDNRRAFLRGNMGALAGQAQRALEQGGEPALREWLRAKQTELPTPLLVVTPDGRELLDRALPPVPLGLLQRRAERRGGPGPPVRALRAADGRDYLLLPAPAKGRRLGGWFGQRGARPVFFVVLILVSGVICLLLARYLTRPLDKLRAAGQAIAAGDLAARAGGNTGARRDEIGALARDFDRMAERVQQLVESQQRLLRDVSHELRSPLTRLQAAAGLLRQRADAEETPNLDRIDKEVAQLDELIGQILAYTRLEQLDRVDRSPVDLVSLLADVVADARYEGAAAGIGVSLDAPATQVVQGDIRLLHSALENVVRNAVQHAESRVRVSVESTNDGLRVLVSDDGPGVDAAALARLFEPFYTGTEMAARGAGIGLAITQRAVNLHGGEVAARNGPAGGLEIEISLPAGS